MRRVLKWPWDPRSDTMEVPWSPGDRVLMVAEQHGQVTLWAEQEDASVTGRREFVIVGTGDVAPAGLVHVGSTIAGPFVWHVYTEPVLEVPL